MSLNGLETLDLVMPAEEFRPPRSADLNPYRALPSVDELAGSPVLVPWTQRLPRELVVSAIRSVLAQCRQEVSLCNGDANFSLERLSSRVDAYLEEGQRPALCEVINGTGILIHTGLGRAPLSSRALDAILQASRGYTALELNLDNGGRGQRVDVVRNQLCALTEAESATVVNNNCAALVVTLATLAAGKQVIVSRGELIEIGGSFRLPEIMAASGAELREVGTTNKTRASDYLGAVNDSTGCLLKVHPSNYCITGFAQSVGIDELVALGRKHNLPVIHDIGSGALFELAALGLANEPVARASIAAGADLVLFSGDKLVGGPQAGVIVGRRKYIDEIERHPLMRALRVDKLTLAALSATLSALCHPQQAVREIPLWTMESTPIDELRRRALAIVGRVTNKTPRADVAMISSTAYLGGGSLPNHALESVAIAARSEHASEEDLARRLRLGRPPVVGRLQDRSLVIDLRAVFPHQDDGLADVLAAALQS